MAGERSQTYFVYCSYREDNKKVILPSTLIKDRPENPSAASSSTNLIFNIYYDPRFEYDIAERKFGGKKTESKSLKNHGEYPSSAEWVSMVEDEGGYFEGKIVSAASTMQELQSLLTSMKRIKTKTTKAGKPDKRRQEELQENQEVLKKKTKRDAFINVKEQRKSKSQSLKTVSDGHFKERIETEEEEKPTAISTFCGVCSLKDSVISSLREQLACTKELLDIHKTKNLELKEAVKKLEQEKKAPLVLTASSAQIEFVDFPDLPSGPSSPTMTEEEQLADLVPDYSEAAEAPPAENTLIVDPLNDSLLANMGSPTHGKFCPELDESGPSVEICNIFLCKPPILTRNNASKTIHIGYDIWISITDWLKIQDATSDTLFVKRLTIAAVGDDKIIQYSTSGKSGSKGQGEAKKPFPREVWEIVKYFFTVKICREEEETFSSLWSFKDFKEKAPKASGRMQTHLNVKEDGTPKRKGCNGNVGKWMGMASQEKNRKTGKNGQASKP